MVRGDINNSSVHGSTFTCDLVNLKSQVHHLTTYCSMHTVVFILIGPYTQETMKKQKRGTKLGKSGLELRSPEVQIHRMPDLCPLGYGSDTVKTL